jgi:hypothetical protein
MEAIKDEFGDDEVPLVSSWLRNQDDIPDEFNLMEWNELAGVIIAVLYYSIC